MKGTHEGNDRREPRESIGSRRALLLCGCLVLAAAAVACHRSGGGAPIETVLRGPTMGTGYEVKVLSAEALDASMQADLEGRVEAELAAVDGAMSTYKESSELSALNRHLTGEPFPLSAATFEVFELALEVTELSDGAFDITVAPLVEAWGFGAGGVPGHPPDAVTVNLLRSHVGASQLELDRSTHSVRKASGNVRCDLSAIAKGYAVDRVATALAELGFGDYLVEIGGEVRSAGHNRHGRPWQIAVERPDPNGRSVQRVVSLSDAAMATSGDYRNFYEVGGKRYSHTIDPRTGRPVTHHLGSVSVIHHSTAEADAWATALDVLGPDEGVELAEERKLAALFLVYNDVETLGGDGGGRAAVAPVTEIETEAWSAFVDTGLLTESR